MADKLKQGRFDSFTIIDNGLIETDLLTEHEKIVYIVIRKHLNQEKQTAFPGMATIAREARICKSVVVKAIQGLEEKGLLTVERQLTKYNEKKTNIYSFNDFAGLWKAKTVDELKKIANETSVSLTDDEIICKALQIEKQKRQELYNQLAKEFEKEREPVNEPSKAHTQAPNNQNIPEEQNTTDKPKSQEERYTLEEIHQLFDYKILLNDYPDRQQDIDCAIDVLHTTLNTSKPTIRVSGEDKPTMAVISKLMKLDKDDIMFALDRFAGQTERVKNPTAYLLAILYSAKEQYHFDTINRVSHDMAHWEDSYHEGSRKAELERNLLQESSYLSLQQLSNRG
jgi:DNA-binding transcriptional regulator YhcF (GntR family)